nr:MAG TPA: hypothetical protein [Caudoviricetes sp.]
MTLIGLLLSLLPVGYTKFLGHDKLQRGFHYDDFIDYACGADCADASRNRYMKEKISLPRVIGVSMVCLLVTGSVDNKWVVAIFLLLIAAWLTLEIYLKNKKCD